MVEEVFSGRRTANGTGEALIEVAGSGCRVGLVRTGRAEAESASAVGPSGEAGAGVVGAVSLAGGLERRVSRGARVLVKPNLVAVPPHPRNGAVTWAAVTRAVADLVRDLGGHPIIADSAAVGANTEDVMAVCGYHRLREMGYEVLDLKSTPEVEVQVPAGLVVSRLVTYRPVLEADLVVSVPVLKTHDQLGASLGLKNLKGLLADRDKRHLHAVGVVEGICDLLTVLPPLYAVVDGTVGQEGLGPVYGRPVPLGVILAGGDLVAVDAVAGWIMGLTPAEQPLVRRASERGLGCADLAAIHVAGVDPALVQQRFLRPEEDASRDVPGFRVIFTPGTCTGCHHTVLSVVARLEEEGEGPALRGKTVLAGPVGHWSPCEGEVILVGNCLAGYECLGTWVEGCPPDNAWVKEALLASAPRDEN